jgi:hypothetical protein
LLLPLVEKGFLVRKETRFGVGAELPNTPYPTFSLPHSKVTEVEAYLKKEGLHPSELR